MVRLQLLLIITLVVLSGSACSRRPPPPAPSPAPVPTADPIAELLGSLLLERLGYAIQVGAFARQSNAVGLEQRLEQRGIDAFYLRDASGLFKVRFGDYHSYDAARRKALELQRSGQIGNFFIIRPESYRGTRPTGLNRHQLRLDLVATARNYLGVPYLWGGESRRGFDCSGLTMVSYRLNGLKLPRNSRMQYRAGRAVKRARLQPGDLVFFATHGGKRVTHVGLYAGGGLFIHAPRSGKTVREARLESRYWQKVYVGGRSYL